MFHSNEIYSDQIENKNDLIDSINQLGENKKSRNDDQQLNLEELLIKSRQLNSSKSIRLINEEKDELPTTTTRKKKSSQRIENLILSCNLFNHRHQSIHWKHLPKHLQYLELSGNFIESLNGIEDHCENLQSLGLSFNEIKQIDQIFSIPKWLNLYLIDLSYNLLNNLISTIQSLNNIHQLRILYLHGNPLSLIVDYRLYVIDSLIRLLILDDITITTEERFRARDFTHSNEHPKDYSQFQITFGSISNLPSPPLNQNEWPLQIHRYYYSLDWFEGEKEDIEIPFDKFANFNRFHQTTIQSPQSEHKSLIEFSPNHLNYTIPTLIPFRDWIFRGTTCRVIHQMTEYWPPGEINEDKSSKKKSNTEKKVIIDSPPKKKKSEDLNKLIIRTDPIRTILAEFHIELRSFLDGDYQLAFPYQSLLQQQQIDSMNQQQNLPLKSIKKKDKQIIDSSKDKIKDKQKVINSNDPIPLPQPFQCSIHFQLYRFVSQQQLI